MPHVARISIPDPTSMPFHLQNNTRFALRKQNIAEDYVKFLTMAVPSTLTLKDISKANARDKSLCAPKNMHLSNGENWNNLKLKPFKQV